MPTILDFFSTFSHQVTFIRGWLYRVMKQAYLLLLVTQATRIVETVQCISSHLLKAECCAEESELHSCVFKYSKTLLTRLCFLF